MLRTFAVVAAGTALAFSTLGTGTALASGIDGAGTGGACPVRGKIGIKPPIAGFPNPDTSPPAAIKFSTKTVKLSTCSGGTGDGAHVVTVKGKGTGMTDHSSCSGLAGTTPINITVTLKWKTDKTVKLNPSTVQITSATGGVAGDGHATFDATGTVTAGSFTGNNVSAHIEADQTAGDLATGCNGSGIKKLTFTLNSSLTLN